jgi:hypothetical protein
MSMNDIRFLERDNLVQTGCCSPHQPIQFGKPKSGNPAALLARALEAPAFDIFDRRLRGALLGRREASCLPASHPLCL